MARSADQIVTEQLGALHLQFVLAVARAEAAEEKVAELTAQVNALSASKKGEDEKVEGGPSEVKPVRY
jgi:hypothetical protein